MPLLSGLRWIPVTVLAVVLAVADAKASDRWPAFQGPPPAHLEAADLPLNWSPTKNIAWQVKLTGYGQSSPVVWDGRVYVTSISGALKENCHVCAFQLETGKKLWQYDLAAATQVENTNYISKAAPSPVVDQHGVIALFEGGNLVALTHDGERRWQRDLVVDYGSLESRHGLASSLEQNHGRVFVWMERQEDPYILALSKSTGETIWKERGLGATSWSSPRLVPVDEGFHLVLSGIGKLAGMDPETGQRLWDFEDISGNSTPTPIPLGDGRFLIGATVGRGETGIGKAAASNGVVQIAKGEDGTLQPGWLWRAARATSSFGSPLAHDGYAYFVNSAGVVYCLDLQTGREVYARRTAESIWATPIAVGQRIYLFGRTGTTSIIKAGPEFEVLAENHLWEQDAIKSSPDPADGLVSRGPILYAVAALKSQLILRSGDRLYSVAIPLDAVAGGHLFQGRP